jgi:phosphate-selective porin OprO and OprP
MIFALSVLPGNPAFAQDVTGQEVATVTAEPATGKASTEDASDWQIKPRWRLQYDIADIDGPMGLPGSGSTGAIRRARLGVDIGMPAGFSARVDAEFQNQILLLDAYVSWEKNDLIVMVGQQKAVNPLDLHGSNLNTSFMERPAFYTAFNYGRGTGVLLGYERDDVGVFGGVFTDALVNLNDVKDNSISADFRGYWSPQLGKLRLHFGASYHLRDLNDFADQPTRYRQRPFVRITDTRYIGTPGLRVDQEQRYGLETAAVYKRVHAAAEIHWLNASRTGLADPTFFGGYAEAGFFLTNDSRPLKAGAFGTIKPKKPLGKGGLGAVQVNVRYDYLSLNSAGVTGGTQNGYLASLVWTPVEYFKFILNYARLDYSDATIAVAGDRDYSVDVVGARFQLSY